MPPAKKSVQQMTHEEILEIHNLKNDCDLETRYWLVMYHRYKRPDINLGIICGICGSGTFVSVVGTLIGKTHPIVAGLLTIVTTGLGVAYKQLNHKKVCEDIKKHRANWIALEAEYKKLWLAISTIDSVEIRTRLEKLQQTHVLIAGEGTDLAPEDKDLQLRCYQEVCVANGCESLLPKEDNPQLTLAGTNQRLLPKGDK